MLFVLIVTRHQQLTVALALVQIWKRYHVMRDDDDDTFRTFLV